MIIAPSQWHVLWEAIKDDFPQSTEKGVAVIFSLQEVETVCAVKMLLVRSSVNCSMAACCMHAAYLGEVKELSYEFHSVVALLMIAGIRCICFAGHQPKHRGIKAYCTVMDSAVMNPVRYSMPAGNQHASIQYKMRPATAVLLKPSSCCNWLGCPAMNHCIC
jgi:hypothetical protein